MKPAAPAKKKPAKPSPRSEGRLAAVQFLYAAELNSGEGAATPEEFWSLHQARPNVREFAETLIAGVIARREEIDARLKPALENWDFNRLEIVDRNILRLAIHEMWHCLDTPPVVAINEAIEVAKRLGTPDSARFVNGVLDRLKRDLDRPLRTAANAPAPPPAAS